MNERALRIAIVRDPEKVLILGDLHGNWRCAMSLFERLPELLPGESPRVILQVGDFGIWDGKEGARYLMRLTHSLINNDAYLAFIDGNHECFPLLKFYGQRGLEGNVPSPLPGARYINDRIWHIPRGLRWSWQGKTWLGLGGAVSVDRALRTEGESWWPEEEITPEQAIAVAEAGHADIMLTHDCPWESPHPPFPPPPPLWVPYIKRSNDHQKRLQHVVDAVQPSTLIHGHLHMDYRAMADMKHGPVDITGLSYEYSAGSWGVFDTRELSWVPVRGSLCEEQE